MIKRLSLISQLMVKKEEILLIIAKAYYLYVLFFIERFPGTHYTETLETLTQIQEHLYFSQYHIPAYIVTKNTF